MRKNRKNRGGGWTDGPTFVNPGNLTHNQYSGQGKDCTGNPDSIRPGYIMNANPYGLPGFSRGGMRNKRKYRGGAAMPAVASYDFTPGPVANPNLPPVSGSLTPKPEYFPNPTGTGGTVANPQGGSVVMSMPGVPPPGMAQMQKTQMGGRYGVFPGMGPLNPNNGVGTILAPFRSIPCERGTYDALNPNPNGIQLMSTAPLTPPFVTMKGGASIPAGTSYAASAANFPTVQVGQADSMRYYAPTAGYRNDFMTFKAPSAVPGLTIQTPYSAGAFNQACIKTGGSRKKNRKNKRGVGGALPVGLDAGSFTPVTMNEVGTRKDFDGSGKGLPVKFGGGRRRVIKKTKGNRKN